MLLWQLAEIKFIKHYFILFHVMFVLFQVMTFYGLVRPIVNDNNCGSE